MGARPNESADVFMNSMFSDKEGHSIDDVLMGQHDDDDPLPQILQDFLETNIPDHTPTTGGNYTGPDPIPTPLLKVNVFYMSNLKCQFTMVSRLAC